MRGTKPIVKLSQFEGPYDALLDLIQRQQLDVSEVSLAKVTDDFLALTRSGSIAPELLADFLAVAATLLLLKIRQAMPSLDAEETEEINQLTDRVRMYQL